MNALTMDRRRLGTVLAVLMSGLVVALFIMRVSSAGFTDSTDNPGNSWQTGAVKLTNDKGATALFEATNLDGGAVTIKCINVTYEGFTTGTHAKMFVTDVTGGLADFLTVKVEEGTGATDDACTNFTPAGAAIFEDTLTAFSAHNNWATAVGDWEPTASPETRSYRITTTVADDSDAQGLPASAKFNWEAQH